jgi:hypothetical protein
MYDCGINTVAQNRGPLSPGRDVPHLRMSNVQDTMIEGDAWLPGRIHSRVEVPADLGVWESDKSPAIVDASNAPKSDHVFRESPTHACEHQQPCSGHSPNWSRIR